MKSYINSSDGPSITVHYNGYVEAYMLGYYTGSVVPYITVHFNGKLEASLQGDIVRTVGGPQ
jgi:hypothetical protein